MVQRANSMVIRELDITNDFHCMGKVVFDQLESMTLTADMAVTGETVFNATRDITNDAYGYGFTIDGGETFFSGGAAQKSYLLYLTGSREDTYPATGDSNDALLRANFNNYAANDANFIMRGINVSMGNRSGGTLGQLIGASFGSQNRVGGTAPYIIGLTVTPENYGTCATEFGGIDIPMKNEGAVATTEFGVRVRNLNNSLATAVGAAYCATDTGANTGFNYILDCYGATVQKMQIRLGQEGGLDVGIVTGNFTDGAASAFGKGSVGLDDTDGLLFVTDGNHLWQQYAVA
jgi:hypothetical protein